MDDPSRERSSVEAAEAVATRQRICEAAQRIVELDGERYALEEARDGLEARARDLERRLVEARAEATGLEDELAVRRQRDRELAGQIEGIRLEIGGLEREAAEATVRAREIVRETERVAGELRRRRAGTAALEAELRVLCETVARMDRKLDSAERRRTLAPPSPAGKPGPS